MDRPFPLVNGLPESHHTAHVHDRSHELFEELGMELVCALRMDKDITSEQHTRLDEILSPPVIQAEESEQIPNSLVYAFMVLRDNLIGTHNRMAESVLIEQPLSRLDLAFEDILLGD